jgi:probable rRNA maturation factor
MKLEIHIPTGTPEELHEVSFDKLFSDWKQHTEPDLAGIVLLQFVDRNAMEALVQTHQGKKGATDVLSFTYDPPLADNSGGSVSGEIVICTEVASENAQKLGVSMDLECATLFVHGLLHLTGLDHANPEDRQQFEAKTRGIMEIGGLTPVSLWLD